MAQYRELYQPSNTLIGAGAIKRIPHFVRRMHGQRALVVSDEGLVKIGTVAKVLSVLDNDNIEYVLFTDVKPNPTTAIVNAGYEVAQRHQCDYVIGIGGGSPLDVAKAVAILMTNGGDIRDYEGVNQSPKRSLPIIAVNTTAGTGSEVTRDYVITDEEKKVKMLMVDYHCIASLAIDDPMLMTGMPPKLTAATGMDALTHAIEAYVCKSHFPYSDGLALEAIRLVATALRKAVENGNDIEARTDMCWAEYMAGLAFSNSGLGLVHAMAHQLGGFYNMPHGVANAILLPYVMEYNSSECKDRYAVIASAFGINTTNMTCDQAAQKAIQFIKNLSEDIGIPPLKSLGFRPEDAITLSINAANDTCISDNPKEASITDIKSVFLNAYNG
ncbi:iron-containing alcohol dehydrogenase [Faecalicatena contorta]|uniref:iron-containing alcohol dehydrogenase n=1 Tax=Faecalicatena contorta TaxID=39482 RepID=UPI001F3C6CBE|nr:iron-containing alcohol dehydrogenase [Faecalicatena contorta]MCF2555403.1 iron-containing alcohol dehydrogenase [Faecalicatena contorta]